MGYQLLLHGFVPESCLSELLEEVVVHHLELPRQNTPAVDVAGVRLNRLVVAKDLGCGGCWHGGNQETVPDTKPGREVGVSGHTPMTTPTRSLCNLFLEGIPVPAVCGRDPPHVVLEYPLTDRRTLICFIRALRLCQLT